MGSARIAAIITTYGVNAKAAAERRIIKQKTRIEIATLVFVYILFARTSFSYLSVSSSHFSPCGTFSRLQNSFQTSLYG